jgi:7SK snRNA methylphosphate capping enzyme
LTKWVHLHHGDDGIRSFFAKIYRVLAPGGRLVLEPQSWATYKDAVKKTQGAVPKTRLAELELRPTDFGQVLGALGFERETLLREAGVVADQKSTDANQAGM